MTKRDTMTVRQQIIHSVGGKIALARGDKYRNTGKSESTSDLIIMDALESIETVIAGADEYLDKAEASRIAWRRLISAINKRADEVFDYIKHNADREQAKATEQATVTTDAEQATETAETAETAVSALSDEQAVETPEQAIQTPEIAIQTPQHAVTPAQQNNDNRAVLMPESWQGTVSKSVRSRLEKFCKHLDVTGRHWFQPDLASYRDELLKTGKSPATVKAYLSTVRSRYKRLVLDRDDFYALVPSEVTDIAQRKAIADEMIVRLENAINPILSEVKAKRVQRDKNTGNKVVDTHTRLSRQQVKQLLDNMPARTPAEKRNRAIMALLLTTGLRVDELVNLQVQDLDRVNSDGVRYLYIRDGKGSKERPIAWGDNRHVISEYVMPWLQSLATFYRSNIRPNSEGLLPDDFIFVPLAKGGKHTLNGGKYDAYENRETSEKLAMSTRAVQKLFKSLPLPTGIEKFTPHDCRRTYAKIQFDAGVPIADIRDNLGHDDIRTTQSYIGQSSLSQRQNARVL